MHACYRQSLLLLCCSLLHRDALLHGALLLISMQMLIMESWGGLIEAPLELRAGGDLGETSLNILTGQFLLFLSAPSTFSSLRKLPSVPRKVLSPVQGCQCHPVTSLIWKYSAFYMFHPALHVECLR